MEEEIPDIEAVSDKGIREFIQRDVTQLSAVVPGILRGVIDANILSISDARLVEYAKKLVGFLSETFEFPHLFGDIHEKIARVIAAGADKLQPIPPNPPEILLAWGFNPTCG